MADESERLTALEASLAREAARSQALEALLLTVIADFAAEAVDRVYYLDSIGRRARSSLPDIGRSPSSDAAHRKMDMLLARLENSKPGR